MSPRTNSDLESKEDCRRFDPRLYANIGSWLGRLLCACPHALSLTISAQQARRQQTMSASLLHHGELAEADRGEASALSLSPRTRCESCPSAPTKPASNSINPHLLPAMGVWLGRKGASSPRTGRDLRRAASPQAIDYEQISLPPWGVRWGGLPRDGCLARASSSLKVPPGSTSRCSTRRWRCYA